MALTNEERGFLEKLIDKEISGIKDTIDIARSESNRKEWQIKDDADFALGWSLGTITSNFGNYYGIIHRSKLIQSDLDQTVEIVTKRVREIKEAIFNCG